jgi:hypothetical protein
MLILTAVAVINWPGDKQARATAAQVKALLRSVSPQNNFSTNEQRAVFGLVQMGPSAYPEMGRILRLRNVSGDRLYARWVTRLPKVIRARLPDPDEGLFYQGRIAGAIRSMGPEACRALLGAVCDNLESGPNPAIEVELLRSLYWSIPESPRAVRTLDNYLRHAPHGHLFGFTDALEIWPAVPELARPLLPWLKYMDTTRDACMGLGAIGTNARFAVPHLVEVAEQGVGGKPPSYYSRTSYADYIQPRVLNSLAAIDALGKIGVRSPAVITVLSNAIITSTNAEIRTHSLLALADLGQPIEEYLSQVITNQPLYLSFQTERWLETLARLGPKGKAAAPFLEPYTDLERLNQLPPPASGTGDFAAPPAWLHLTATIAVCKLDPSGGDKHLPFLLNSTEWKATDLLSNWQPFTPEFQDRVASLLNSTNAYARIRAASILLHHNPGDNRALNTLKLELTNAPQVRAYAALSFWREMHDATELLPILRADLLGDNSDVPLQSVLQTLGEIGDKSAVPEIKQSLRHRDQFVRYVAGKMLRKIAPDQMPPINER